MYTYGQMALENNQRGYDVISAEGDRISVKTITTSKHVAFNKTTFSFVDRIVILEINTTDLEINILIDAKKDEFIPLLKDRGAKLFYYPRDKHRIVKPLSEMTIINDVSYKSHLIRQYENSTIEILTNGVPEQMAKPVLKIIAKELNVNLLNSAGSPKNTRQLGDHIIKAIKAMNDVF
ncbi:hypothetical protein PEC302107_24730 [Pectobacterium araliae]|nr:hypothetical protein PEC302107_24730 [Pectobacterium carotovorum subsp. carotovorum]